MDADQKPVESSPITNSAKKRGRPRKNPQQEMPQQQQQNQQVSLVIGVDGDSVVRKRIKLSTSSPNLLSSASPTPLPLPSPPPLPPSAYFKYGAPLSFWTAATAAVTTPSPTTTSPTTTDVVSSSAKKKMKISAPLSSSLDMAHNKSLSSSLSSSLLIEDIYDPQGEIMALPLYSPLMRVFIDILSESSSSLLLQKDAYNGGGKGGEEEGKGVERKGGKKKHKNESVIVQASSDLSIAMLRVAQTLRLDAKALRTAFLQTTRGDSRSSSSSSSLRPFQLLASLMNAQQEIRPETFFPLSPQFEFVLYTAARGLLSEAEAEVEKEEEDGNDDDDDNLDEEKEKVDEDDDDGNREKKTKKKSKKESDDSNYGRGLSFLEANFGLDISTEKGTSATEANVHDSVDTSTIMQVASAAIDRIPLSSSSSSSSPSSSSSSSLSTLPQVPFPNLGADASFELLRQIQAQRDILRALSSSSSSSGGDVKEGGGGNSKLWLESQWLKPITIGEEQLWPETVRIRALETARLKREAAELNAAKRVLKKAAAERLATELAMKGDAEDTNSSKKRRKKVWVSSGHLPGTLASSTALKDSRDFPITHSHGHSANLSAGVDDDDLKGGEGVVESGFSSLQVEPLIIDPLQADVEESLQKQEIVIPGIRLAASLAELITRSLVPASTAFSGGGGGGAGGGGGGGGGGVKRSAR